MSNLILLVDDDKDFCETMKTLLRKVTEDVHVAANYKQAAELLGAGDYDIVICDLNLGDLSYDGFSLFRAFNKEESDPHDPMSHWVFISGDVTKAEEVLGLQNSSFVSKGEGASKLINHVQQITYMQSILSNSAEAMNPDSLMEKLEDILLTQDVYSKGMRLLKAELRDGFGEMRELLQTATKKIKEQEETIQEQKQELDSLKKEVEPSWARLGSWLEFMYTHQILTVGLLLLCGIYFFYFRAI